MKQKLTSRKLWAAIVGVATGIYTIVSGDTTSGTTLVITSVVGYLAAEGIVDIARVISTIVEAGNVAKGVADSLEVTKED